MLFTGASWGQAKYSANTAHSPETQAVSGILTGEKQWLTELPKVAEVHQRQADENLASGVQTGISLWTKSQSAEQQRQCHEWKMAMLMFNHQLSIVSLFKIQTTEATEPFI